MPGAAPGEVGRNVLNKILQSAEKLPFDEVKLYTKHKFINEIQNEFKDIEILTYRNLHKIHRDDVIHFTTLPTVLPNSKFLLYIYALLKKCRIIIQYHGDVRNELRSSYKDVVSLCHIITYVAVPKLLKNTDAVITHSYYMDSIIKKYGVKNSFVIPNAVDVSWFQSFIENTSTNDNVDNDNFNIFYHGRLSWEKGVDMLLEAFAKYVHNFPHSKLYLAGDGGQLKHLGKMCSMLGINKNVVFLGKIRKKTIMHYLKNVDIAIYPSRFDNFPLAIMEAMACAQCPVYFSRNVGIYDFIVQDSYQLCDFEPTMDNIYNILYDHSAITNNEIVQLQRKFAKKYTWDKVVEQYINVYKKLQGNL